MRRSYRALAGLGRRGAPVGAAAALVAASALLPVVAGAGPAASATPRTTVLAWGNGSDGQLGTGNTSNSPFPIPVSNLTDSGWVGVSAGTGHSLLRRANGRALSWGLNDEGQLGNAKSGAGTDTPGGVVGPGGTGRLSNIVHLAAGNVDSMALRSDGTVWSWGDNIWGQLGTGTTSGPQHCPRNDDPSSQTSCSKYPRPVVGPNGTGELNRVTSLAGAENNGIVVRSDGSVWTWGLNDEGQLGTGQTTGPSQCKPYSNFAAVACSATPQRVHKVGGTGFLGHAVQVASGESFMVALRSDGTVRAWGSDRSADLGQAQPPTERCTVPFFPVPTPCSTTPLVVTGPDGTGALSGIVAISANPSPDGLSVLALRSDGTVWAWGVDDLGQLGNGMSEEFSNLPVEVVGPGGDGHLDHVVAISAGGRFSMALRSDGTVFAWGANGQGQLGIGTTTGPETCTTDETPCSTSPVQVTGVGGTGALTGVTSLSAGSGHTLAISTPGPPTSPAP